MSQTLSLPTDKHAFYRLSKRERAELYEEAQKRIKSLPNDEQLLNSVDDITINEDLYFMKNFKAFHSLIEEDMNQRSALIESALNGKGDLLESFTDTPKKAGNMENLELRSFQKYVTNGYKNMDEQEQRALNVSGSAVVIPTEVFNKLITDQKYSTLLNRATVFQEASAGKINIPIISSNSAVWHVENAPGTEATGALTAITLGGFELMRLAQISAAAHSLSTENFEQMLLQVLGSEVIEALEDAFVSGTGDAQPKGLDNLTYVLNTNLIEATASLKAESIAKGISLLPAKYARNAVVMMNTKTLSDVALFTAGTGTSFAYDLSTGAQQFLSHEILVNEHIENDVVYVIDPAELYVRFSLPLQLEANKSSSFKSASIDLRALTVADSAWNPKAVVKVAIAA